jgi:hypothetical protein
LILAASRLGLSLTFAGAFNQMKGSALTLIVGMYLTSGLTVLGALYTAR